MKKNVKQAYEAPKVDIIEVRVEKGFSGSGNWGEPSGRQQDFGMTEHIGDYQEVMF